MGLHQLVALAQQHLVLLEVQPHERIHDGHRHQHGAHGTKDDQGQGQPRQVAAQLVDVGKRGLGCRGHGQEGIDPEEDRAAQQQLADGGAQVIRLEGQQGVAGQHGRREAQDVAQRLLAHPQVAGVGPEGSAQRKQHQPDGEDRQRHPPQPRKPGLASRQQVHRELHQRQQGHGVEQARRHLQRGLRGTRPGARQRDHVGPLVQAVEHAKEAQEPQGVAEMPTLLSPGLEDEQYAEKDVGQPVEEIAEK